MYVFKQCILLYKSSGVFLFCFKATEKLQLFFIFKGKQRLTSFRGGYLWRKYPRCQKKEVLKASEENDSWIYEVYILQVKRLLRFTKTCAHYKTFYSSFTKFIAIMRNSNKAISFREHTVFKMVIYGVTSPKQASIINIFRFSH